MTISEPHLSEPMIITFPKKPDRSILNSSKTSRVREFMDDMDSGIGPGVVWVTALASGCILVLFALYYGLVLINALVTLLAKMGELL